jgi:hypothetical protein
MISQGKLFPFENLKDTSDAEYSNYSKTDIGKGTMKKGENFNSNSKTENLGVNYEFIDDVHTVSQVNDGLDIENFNLKENMKEGEEPRREIGGEERHREVADVGKNGGRGERHHEVVGGGGYGEPRREMVGGGGYKEHRRERGGEIVFWTENPNILFYPDQMYELFPVANMNYNQKLNSITRLVILLTIVGFLFVRNMRIIWIGAVCLLAIFLLQYTQNKTRFRGVELEGFDGGLEDLGVDAPAQAVINAFATDDPSKIGKRVFFDTPKANNPYNNVLITDIVDNPKKLPALPAYYPETEKEILDKTKEAIQKMNPTFPNMTEKLFASLDDHFEFEQSARQFYSNPSTTIPNDQGAFAEFCYGEMISCKEGNMFACARDAPRHNLY